MRSPRRHNAAAARDGREPQGFASVLQGLLADRAWSLPAASGSLLDQWADIAATISPKLPEHVAAVAFHPETGQLDLRPDSPVYATQLRLISRQIIAAVNTALSTAAVRTVRVLAVGGTPESRPAELDPAPASLQTPEPTAQMASEGYRRALAAHRQATPPRLADPNIAGAVERQTQAMRELSRRAFPETETAADDEPALIEQARTQRRRQAAVTEAAALRRSRAEKGGHRLPAAMRTADGQPAVTGPQPQPGRVGWADQLAGVARRPPSAEQLRGTA
ncbi:DUF721 domain-containing protein [Streptomyces sp. 769]|uniref:DciA family protein n=1 Tax=Streptomyces sp. 769 TaxID=1262452 RepID=UPI001EEF94BA|nr:DUF721 domain-containing protein [Streptomyces sp. 769]